MFEDRKNMESLYIPEIEQSLEDLKRINESAEKLLASYKKALAIELESSGLSKKDIGVAVRASVREFLRENELLTKFCN